MKLTLITALLGFGMSATSLAAEAFRVYAPSSKTQTLWIVDAVPMEDGGLGKNGDTHFSASSGESVGRFQRLGPSRP